MVLSRRRKLTIISLLIYWPVFFIVAHIPIPELVRRAGVSDKCLHFLAYLTLVYLFWFAISPGRKVNWRKATVWWILFVIVCYGVFDELLQSTVGRSCDVMDFVANLVGALTGLIMFSFFTFWSSTLLVTGAVIFGLTNIARADLAELVPAINAMFNLLAYPVFTMVWIQYIHRFLPLKPPEANWLITASALPIGFLLTVRLFSIILGKNFHLQDVIISAVGIVAVVVTLYLIAMFRKTQNTRSRTKNFE